MKPPHSGKIQSDNRARVLTLAQEIQWSITKNKKQRAEKYSAKKIAQTFYDMHFGLGKIDSF